MNLTSHEAARQEHFKKSLEYQEYGSGIGYVRVDGYWNTGREDITSYINNDGKVVYVRNY